MIQLIHCILMLLPLIALPVGVFLVSPLLGLALAVVAAILAIPLVLAAVAHYDLVRAKSRYGLSEDELEEFMRLVPVLSRTPEFAGLPARRMRRSVKDAAAEIVRSRRARPTA